MDTKRLIPSWKARLDLVFYTTFPNMWCTIIKNQGIKNPFVEINAICSTCTEDVFGSKKINEKRDCPVCASKKVKYKIL